MLDVKKVREDFPILSRKVYGKPLVYLDNAATSQKPRSVIESLTTYYEEYNANVHRGVHALSMEATDRMEEARQKVADFIGAAAPESIIWTRNATEALNLAAYSWAQVHVQPSDEIVVTQMEHHSNLVPWQKVAADKEATLRVLPLSDQGTLDQAAVDETIGPQTRLLAIAHMSNSLGTINPVKELAAKARAVGATVLVDGAQSAPHMPVDVADLDCDFFALSGHKMLGPTGIGALYAAPAGGRGDGAVPSRRRDGTGGLERPRHLERPADEVRGGYPQHRRRYRSRRGDRLPQRPGHGRGQAARERAHRLRAGGVPRARGRPGPLRAKGRRDPWRHHVVPYR